MQQYKTYAPTTWIQGQSVFKSLQGQCTDIRAVIILTDLVISIIYLHMLL